MAWIDGIFAWIDGILVKIDEIDEIDIFASAGTLDIFRFFFLEAPFPFICLLRFRSLAFASFSFPVSGFL